MLMKVVTYNCESDRPSKLEIFPSNLLKLRSLKHIKKYIKIKKKCYKKVTNMKFGF